MSANLFLQFGYSSVGKFASKCAGFIYYAHDSNSKEPVGQYNVQLRLNPLTRVSTVQAISRFSTVNNLSVCTVFTYTVNIAQYSTVARAVQLYQRWSAVLYSSVILTESSYVKLDDANLTTA